MTAKAAAPMATKTKSRARLIIESPFRQAAGLLQKYICKHAIMTMVACFSPLLPSLKRCAFSIKSAKIVGVMSAEPRGYGAGSDSPRDNPIIWNQVIHQVLQTPVRIRRSASAFQTFLAFLPVSVPFQAAIGVRRCVGVVLAKTSFAAGITRLLAAIAR